MSTSSCWSSVTLDLLANLFDSEQSAGWPRSPPPAVHHRHHRRIRRNPNPPPPPNPPRRPWPSAVGHRHPFLSGPRRPPPRWASTTGVRDIAVSRAMDNREMSVLRASACLHRSGNEAVARSGVCGSVPAAADGSVEDTEKSRPFRTLRRSIFAEFGDCPLSAQG